MTGLLQEGERYRLIEGEAFAALRGMPTASVDALVTDPPYSSGGAFRGDRTVDTTAKYVSSGVQIERPDFAGDNRDQRSFFAWCVLWLSECLRVAKPGAVCCVFTDWRQLPTVTDAVQAGGWVWRGIVPWDKTDATRPQMGRPRAQCEYMVFGSAGALASREEVGVRPGITRYVLDELGCVRTPVVLADKFHIAGKPVEVMAAGVNLCVPGGVVLDPFNGSGTTGVACLREGRRYVGIEIDPHWAEVTRKRLEAEASGITLAAAQAGQASLFGGST